MRMLFPDEDDIQVITIKVALSRKNPLFSQVKKLMKEIPNMNNGEQSIVILPGLTVAAALILAYIHGVSGSFPLEVELLKDRSGTWVLHDIHDLEFYRHESRRNR